jgi:methylated-DNA-[protein]-cysteine S-methyltransferase
MKASNLLNYKDMPSPVGTIRLVASDKGLVAVLWEGEDYFRTKLPGAAYSEDNPILLAAEQQLGAYFARTRTAFDLPLDLRGTEFQIRAWEALLQIPYGKTRTYGELARILGDIKAVRAVGGALNKNPVAIIVPCHRVIGASGKLVGFAGGLDRKSLLLSLEQELRMPSLF